MSSRLRSLWAPAPRLARSLPPAPSQHAETWSKSGTLSLSCHLGCQPCLGPRLLAAILRGSGGAWVYLSVSFEVHQIKGSKITDADEVGIDSDGICVSERGPGELPAAREDLGMLKPGQASKDKNCQVTRGGLGDGPRALPLLGFLCLGSLYHGLMRRGFHGHPVAEPPPGSLLSQPLWQDRVFSTWFTCS